MGGRIFPGKHYLAKFHVQESGGNYHVDFTSSSFFEDESYFPKGTISFDNALLMTKIEHEWHTLSAKPQVVNLPLEGS